LTLAQAGDDLTSQEGVSRIASHERASMREESGDCCDSCFRLIKTVGLKEVSPRLKPPIIGKSQALEGIAAMGIQLSTLDGSSLGFPLQLITAQAG
jgi:hypothetical protein